MKKNDFIECQFKNDNKKLYAEVQEVGNGNFRCRFVHNGTIYTFSNSGTVISSNGYYKPGAQLSWYNIYEPAANSNSFTPGQFIQLRFADNHGFLGIMMNKDIAWSQTDYIIRVQLFSSKEIYDIDAYNLKVVKSGGSYPINTSLSAIIPMVLAGNVSGQDNTNVKDVSFEPENIEINEKSKNRVKVFSDFEEKSYRQFQAFNSQFNIAISDVSDCFKNYPSEKINSDFSLFFDLLEDAFFKLLDNLTEIPGLNKIEAVYDFARKAIDSVQQETEKESQIKGQITTQDWISSQRKILSNLISSYSKGKIISSLETEFYSYDKEGDRDSFVLKIQDLAADDHKQIKPIEAGQIKLVLFEQWINSFYTGTGDDEVSGYLHLKFEHPDSQLNIVTGGATVECLNGNQVANALNYLIKSGIFYELTDIKVAKRIDFYAESIGSMGGHNWYSGWVDKYNQKITYPLQDDAKRWFESDDWLHLYPMFSV